MSTLTRTRRERPTTTPPSPRRGTFPIGKVLGYLTLILFAIIYIYPFLIQIATSVKTNQDATQSPLSLLPSRRPATRLGSRCAC